MENSKEQTSFQKIAEEIGNLVTEKNKSYGDSFSKVSDFLKMLFPDGVKPEQYDDMLFIVRMFDKLMRIANQKNAFNDDAYADLMGYSLLAIERERKKHGNI